MFKKLFGGGKKEEKPAQTKQSQPTANYGGGLTSNSNPTISNEEQIKLVKEKLQKLQSDFDVTIESEQQKIVVLDQEIKELLRKNQNDPRARQKLKIKKVHQKKILNLENKKDVFINLEIDIDTSQTDQESVGVLKQCNEMLKESSKINKQLEKQMDDYEDFKEEQLESEKNWERLANIGLDNTELDDELKQYQMEIDNEAQQQVTQQLNNVQPVQPNTVPNTTYQVNKQPQQVIQQQNNLNDLLTN